MRGKGLNSLVFSGGRLAGSRTHCQTVSREFIGRGALVARKLNGFRVSDAAVLDGAFHGSLLRWPLTPSPSPRSGERGAGRLGISVRGEERGAGEVGVF